MLSVNWSDLLSSHLPQFPRPSFPYRSLAQGWTASWQRSLTELAASCSIPAFDHSWRDSSAATPFGSWFDFRPTSYLALGAAEEQSPKEEAGPVLPFLREVPYSMLAPFASYPFICARTFYPACSCPDQYWKLRQQRPLPTWLMLSTPPAPRGYSLLQSLLSPSHELGLSFATIDCALP